MADYLNSFAAVVDLRALVVETNEKVRRKLFAALLEKNVSSDVAPDEPSALDHLRRAEYGVVILDLRFADGILDVIRAIAHDRRPMVIGTGERDLAQELDDDVLQIIIRKPIALRQFAEVVRSCLDAAPRWRRATARQSDELRTL